MGTSAALKWPTERLTWDEIRARHPNEWVVLVDIEWFDDLDIAFGTASLLGHAKTSAAAFLTTKTLRPLGMRFALLFTGDPSPQGPSHAVELLQLGLR